MTRAFHVIRIAAALLAASPLASPAFASKKDNTFRFASQQTLPGLDKYLDGGGSIAGIVSDALWDTLIYHDPETGDYKGELATAWRWIDDRTLELDLRQGVRFHNGAPFDADDVVYTLNFAANPNNKLIFAHIGSWIDRVEKLGPYKVRLLTKGPFPAAIGNLASPDMPIYPHAYYATAGTKGMSEKPVGSGPYRMTEYARGKYVRFERNPDYFKNSPKPQPKIEKIEMRFIPDAQTRVAEMVAGGLDLIMDVARDQAEQLRGEPGLQIVSGESANVAVLRMNSLPQSSAPQLRDIRVRQAIMHAIDRETMAKYLVGEKARVLHAICHPAEFGCDDSAVPHYAYDPRKARKLLADAGYGNGFDIDLWAYRDRNETEAIVGYLRAVGINARLRFLAAPAVIAARRSGKAALFHSTWFSQPADVSHELSNFHEFAPDDRNRDPEVRDLLLRGDSSIDPNVRKTAYAKALRLIGERAYVLPLYSLPVYYLAGKDLVFKPHLDGRFRFYEMSWQ